MGRPKREHGNGSAANRSAGCAPPLLLLIIIFFNTSLARRLELGFLPIREILIAF